ncbi:hypothetical protein OH492_11370 [Vibrio chagasii]|nr:hypothetical protein [Vibrio chagasii]
MFSWKTGWKWTASKHSGTVDEYPNWRRKLSMNLDEIFAHEGVNRIASKLTNVREKAGK